MKLCAIFLFLVFTLGCSEPIIDKYIELGEKIEKGIPPTVEECVWVLQDIEKTSPELLKPTPGKFTLVDLCVMVILNSALEEKHENG